MQKSSDRDGARSSSGAETLTIAEKKAIIESNLKQISASLYNLSLSKRVADMNDDKENAARIVTEQTKLMKVRDFYTEELGGL